MLKRIVIFLALLSLQTAFAFDQENTSLLWGSYRARTEFYKIEQIKLTDLIELERKGAVSIEGVSLYNGLPALVKEDPRYQKPFYICPYSDQDQLISLLLLYDKKFKRHLPILERMQEAKANFRVQITPIPCPNNLTLFDLAVTFSHDQTEVSFLLASLSPFFKQLYPYKRPVYAPLSAEENIMQTPPPPLVVLPEKYNEKFLIALKRQVGLPMPSPLCPSYRHILQEQASLNSQGAKSDPLAQRIKPVQDSPRAAATAFTQNDHTSYRKLQRMPTLDHPLDLPLSETDIPPISSHSTQSSFPDLPGFAGDL